MYDSESNIGVRVRDETPQVADVAWQRGIADGTNQDDQTVVVVDCVPLRVKPRDCLVDVVLKARHTTIRLKQNSALPLES